MNKFTRVAENDPTRCQATMRGIGQCPYQRVEGSKGCPMHGGTPTLRTAEKKKVHDYKLTMWQERVNDFAVSARVKHLRGEIGIVRMTLEGVIEQIKSPTQMPLYVDKISALTRQIESLVTSCQKLEEKNKDLIGKNEVLLIADAIVNIIAEHISDPDVLVVVSEQIAVSIDGIINDDASK